MVKGRWPVWMQASSSMLEGGWRELRARMGWTPTQFAVMRTRPELTEEQMARLVWRLGLNRSLLMDKMADVARYRARDLGRRPEGPLDPERIEQLRREARENPMGRRRKERG